MPFVLPLEATETWAYKDSQGGGSRADREKSMSQFSFAIDPDSYASIVKQLGIARPALSHRRSSDCTCPHGACAVALAGRCRAEACARPGPRLLPALATLLTRRHGAPHGRSN